MKVKLFSFSYVNRMQIGRKEDSYGALMEKVNNLGQCYKTFLEEMEISPK